VDKRKTCKKVVKNEVNLAREMEKIRGYVITGELWRCFLEQRFSLLMRRRCRTWNARHHPVVDVPRDSGPVEASFGSHLHGRHSRMSFMQQVQNLKLKGRRDTHTLSTHNKRSRHAQHRSQRPISRTLVLGCLLRPPIQNILPNSLQNFITQRLLRQALKNPSTSQQLSSSVIRMVICQLCHRFTDLLFRWPLRDPGQVVRNVVVLPGNVLPLDVEFQQRFS
jgi:hypothetical protein